MEEQLKEEMFKFRTVVEYHLSELSRHQGLILKKLSIIDDKITTLIKYK